MSSSPPPKRVGVFPAAERDRRRVLLDALEDAFPVIFEARLPGELLGLDAAVEFEASEQARAAADAGIRALSFAVPEPVDGDRLVEVTLSMASDLDARLRGAVLLDTHLGEAALSDASAAEMLTSPGGRSTVLACSAGRPLWMRADRLDQALLAPRELSVGGALRERLRDGRCAAILPLVHLLRELTDGIRWRPPKPRAAFLLDDPNLHWPTYGFVKLRELVGHAREHEYHLALATIPLDGWYAHPKAVRALLDANGALSLCIHGNDHSGGELGRPSTDAESVALAAQALRRVEAFELRTGIAVDRVMAPPHEACSEGSVRALLRCGFEGISMTRPFPWAAPPPRSWLAQPEGADALVGWRPADFIAGGLPVFLRHPFAGRSVSELRLRAFLDHPLILYGHHGDLADGLGLLTDAVADVDALRTTSWSSLGEIAAGSYESRREARRLDVRLLARRARIEIPEDSDELAIELPHSHGEPAAERVTVDGCPTALDGLRTEALAVTPGATVEVRLHHSASVDFRTVPPRRPQPLAIARRVASESRDRVLPLLTRAR